MSALDPKLTEIADVQRWNRSMQLDSDKEYVCIELSATKGRVELLKGNDVYERYAIVLLNQPGMEYLLFNYLQQAMPEIRAKYLETMNFKIQDVRNITVHPYFLQ